MFRDRYTAGPQRLDRVERSEVAPRLGCAAAPPGRSMHEIGMAADLEGDLSWMNAHAGEFGLKHFADVNNEPWHVQPVEFPNSRRAVRGRRRHVRQRRGPATAGPTARASRGHGGRPGRRPQLLGGGGGGASFSGIGYSIAAAAAATTAGGGGGFSTVGGRQRHWRCYCLRLPARSGTLTDIVGTGARGRSVRRSLADNLVVEPGVMRSRPRAGRSGDQRLVAISCGEIAVEPNTVGSRT